MAISLSAGAKAPDFALETAKGTVSLADMRGKFLVLYFYPRDDTPGCTKEAIAFTALKDEFGDAGARIIGVSKDTVQKHEKFSAKHALTLTLGADVEGAVCEAYGVWVEKNLYGRKYMGIQRATFLIDSSGQIVHVWPKVKVTGHAEAVLNTLRALNTA